jgi:hypothetical protein
MWHFKVISQNGARSHKKDLSRQTSLLSEKPNVGHTDGLALVKPDG